MTFTTLLQQRVAQTRSLLCVGLDPILERLPPSVPPTPAGVVHFLKQVLEATAPFAAAVKPNFAFFEALGPVGTEVLQEVLAAVPEGLPIIADAKRGDIGTSSAMYARAIFEGWGCHAITVAPYMGSDSVRPFLEYTDRGVFVLCLTSNSGAQDFQLPDLHLAVAKKVQEWNQHENAGLVVGATRPEAIGAIRAVTGPMPYLIPGVGAQGGAMEETLQAAADGTSIPCLINASRSILYASSGEDFAQAAAQEAERLKQSMAAHVSA